MSEIDIAELMERVRVMNEHLAALLTEYRNERAPVVRPEPSAAGDRGNLDAFYLSFENHFRGPREEIKQRLSYYLPVARESDAGSAERPILDLGCGRGEWLELLRDNGAIARGVDLNSSMLNLCRQQGLEVVQADVLEYLRSQPDESQGAITGFHIMEHFPFEILMNVLAESHRVLKPGGVVIFESPNCKNLVVGACHFYIDPTHRNPVFPDTAALMLETQGFDRIRLEYLTPAEGSPFDTNSPGGVILKERFYGPQDFAVIAHKTGEMAKVNDTSE